MNPKVHEKGVTHVSGTICYLSVGTLTINWLNIMREGSFFF